MRRHTPRALLLARGAGAGRGGPARGGPAARARAARALCRAGVVLCDAAGASRQARRDLAVRPEEALIVTDTSETVRYEQQDGVATVTLARPEAMNALTVETKVALLAALRAAAGDDAVRAVVLTGTGRGFCVGQDLREHAGMLASGTEGVESTVREHYNPLALLVATMDKPVVAAVNGMAAGAGASLAMAADLRVAARSAGFLMAFAGVGLAADSGASWTLQRLVGSGRAAELLLLAEPIDAATALDIGLVHRLVEDDELAATAHGLAVRLAAGPTRAYGAIKRQLAFSASHDLASSLENEAVEQEVAGATTDHRDAVTAFVAKARPTFHGR